MAKEAPKVSVCVVTYNQVDYIGTCLRSVLDQRTDFEFEVLVGEDCSTDGTRAVVAEMARRHPTTMKAILHDRNKGSHENYRHVHRAARGDYVAHLDGDDFFLPGKLAKQVAFLDEAAACPAVFHRARIVKASGEETGRSWPRNWTQNRIDVRQLIANHPVFLHSTMMYRRGLLDEFLAERCAFVDYLVYLRLALTGPLGFMNETLGGYREGVGVSRAAYKWIDRLMEALDFAARSGIEDETIRLGRARQLYLAAWSALECGEDRLFATLIEQSVSQMRYSGKQTLYHALRRAPSALRSMRSVLEGLRALKQTSPLR